MQKNAPDFIGIGADHAGLGIIAQLLAAHPEVASTIPTCRFFSTDDFTPGRCVSYETTLPTRTKSQKIGECSDDYLTHQHAAERIVSAYPTTKLFVVVRNPIDRAIAIYEHAKRLGKVTKGISCAQYLVQHPSVQIRGFYGQHLHSFFEYYTSLQLQVIVYEDFAAEPLKVMQELFTFLEINPNVVPKALIAYAPPPDEPKHRGRISRLIHFVVALIKKVHKKPFVPITPTPYNHTQFFSETELATFKAAYAPDSVHLTNLLHRDMAVFWDLLPASEGL